MKIFSSSFRPLCAACALEATNFNFFLLCRLVLMSKLIIYNIAILKSWVTPSYIQFWLWPRIFSYYKITKIVRAF